MSDDAQTPDPQAQGAADPVKEQMRAALERKRQQQHPTAEGFHGDGSEKMHGVDGHIPTQMHRRKAGGGGA